MKAGAFSPTTREQVSARAHYMCERCRLKPGEQWHHRRARGAGGTKRPETAFASNGLFVCAACHAWIESNRSESQRLGYLVRQSMDPRDVAVWIGDRFVFFTDDGGIGELPEEA